jgi:aminoglycoside/choline kinase family phosphotransferase
MPNTRLNELTRWLESLPKSLHLDLQSLEPASSDASFRRYFRISTSHPENPSLIVMDAPIDKEDVKPFIKVADLLINAGLNAPKILETNHS